jgi:heme exporter protein D
MSELRWEAYGTSIAALISLIFIWHPGPYAMGAFTFIAQPLFGVTIASYVWKVRRELRDKRVL